MESYLNLIKEINAEGFDKGDRTGTGTRSMFGARIVHHMKDGFPLLTTRKISLRVAFEELIWFIKGRTDLKYLLDRNIHIWTGDCYKRYLADVAKLEQPDMFLLLEEIGSLRTLTFSEFEQRIQTWPEFATKYGELGPIYGKQWRNFSGVDQLGEVIERLRTNPDCRRLLVSAWNPAEIGQMVLPPCHIMYQFWTRELSLEERIQWAMKNLDLEMENLAITEAANDPLRTPTRAISLQWYQRSVDTCLGLPTNIASYALLLMMVADQVNMVPEKIVFVGGDTHLYNDHIEDALLQSERIPTELPIVVVEKQTNNIEDYVWQDIHFMTQYVHDEQIKYKLSN